MSNINRPIIWNAQNGIVIGETTSRGKTLLTVKMDDGREVKVAERSIEFADIDTWNKPTGTVTFGPKDRDYYGDRARMFARSK